MNTQFTSRKQSSISVLMSLLIIFGCSISPSLFAQTTSTTATVAPVTQENSTYSRDEYVSVPVNIGFVPPVSVGSIVGASTRKRVLSHVSFHVLGNVGNALEGVEWSGLWNTQTDYMRGVQGAGILNTVGGDAGYVQGAGIANIVSGKFEGVQGAGVFNIASGGLKGVQGAGIFNNAGNVEGVQGAGVFNTAKNVKGLQSAGIFNAAENVDGVQAASIFNTAKNVKGVQVGLINIAEDNEGVMLGLLNFSAKYGIRIDLYTDEMRFIRVGLRTGNKSWYNVLTGGMQPFNGVTLWSIGYGVGTQLYLGQKDYFDISLLGEGIYPGNLNRLNLIAAASAGRLRVMFGHDFSQRFSVFLGPTFNIMVGLNNNNLYEAIPELFPGASQTVRGTFWYNGNNDVWARAWIGLTGGFRF